ncbi:MAG: dTMP kinase [Planctomycetes bacterium]|jgi:dTMP kinase|nr:dTMP kinase [Phycisphaerae bacterium]NBB96139.1 dTMP kinase [Planctomycetota bacterium]
MDESFSKLKGRFLVMDGPDGAGKTTQLDLLTEALQQAGLDVARAVDPGGTPAGQQIRDILLHHEDLDLAPMCETMLFMASRAQLVAEVIRPASEGGRVVLCDRFISATLAYQGALGIEPQAIIVAADMAIEKLWPDLTLVLDLPSGEGLSRVGKVRDRMESRTDDYHEQVRRNFQALPGCYPAPVALVDAAGTPEQVHERIVKALESHIQKI